MSRRRAGWLAALLIGWSGPASAEVPFADVPATVVPAIVSPGGPKLLQIESSCPTFSWGAIEGASSYELVVLETEPDSEPPHLDGDRPRIRRTVAGSALSWSTPRASCLEPGASYAWSVRALGASLPGTWPAPALFAVALPEPSELLTAPATRAARRQSRSGRPRAVASPSPAAPGTDELRVSGGVATSAHAGAIGAFIIDGAPAATAADPPCLPAAGDPDEDHLFVDCGNGTVHDTATGLLWLRDANCLGIRVGAGCGSKSGGDRGWWEANAFVATLGSGQCGLSDSSQPGDWRLPTAEELEAILRPACASPPKVFGKAGGCYASPFEAWSCHLESRYWTSLSREESPTTAWGADLDTGGLIAPIKSDDGLYVWPVRGKR